MYPARDFLLFSAISTARRSKVNAQFAGWRGMGLYEAGEVVACGCCCIACSLHRFSDLTRIYVGVFLKLKSRLANNKNSENQIYQEKNFFQTAKAHP